MLAVRAPEYWPRPGFLALAAAAGRLVVADTFQYSRQSYQNRARLRTPTGWQWISVPLRGRQHGRPACAVETEPGDLWLRKHWRSLEYNYRSTPFFEFYEPLLAPVFGQDWPRLGALTARTVEVLVEAFGLQVEVVRASALPDTPTTIADICRVAGGGPLLVPEARHAAEVRAAPDVHAFRYTPPVYRQNFDGWAPEMSALDLLFNHGPEARAMLLAGIEVTPPPR